MCCLVYLFIVGVIGLWSAGIVASGMGDWSSEYLGVTVAAFVTWALVRLRVSRASWRRTARRLGLAELPAMNGALKPLVSGRLDGWSVAAFLFDKQPPSTGMWTHEWTALEIQRASAIPSGLWILGGALGPVESDWPTGDSVLQYNAGVGGGRAQGLAFLNHRVRSLVSRTPPFAELILRNGTIRLEMAGWVRLPGTIRRRLLYVRELANALAEGPPDVAERLAHNALYDPMPDVRNRNLQALADEFPDSEALLWVGEHSVRQSGAVPKDAERRSAIAERAAMRFWDSGCDDASRLVALQLLAIFATDLVLHSALHQATDSTNNAMHLTAAWCMGHRRVARGLVWLGQILGGPDSLLAREAVRALLAYESSEAEGALQRGLSHPGEHVRRSAAVGLQRCGTLASIVPLQCLSRDWWSTAATRRRAHDAIRAIRGRVPNATPGHLSLTDSASESGALSLIPPIR